MTLLTARSLDDHRLLIVATLPGAGSIRRGHVDPFLREECEESPVNASGLGLIEYDGPAYCAEAIGQKW